MEVTGNYIETFEANVTMLQLLIEKYYEGSKWFEEHEKVKRVWIEELTKLNQLIGAGQSPSTRNFILIDLELESSQLDSMERKGHRSELINKIQNVADKIYNLYPDALNEVGKGDAALSRFKEVLRQLKVIFYKSKLPCFENEGSYDLKKGIRHFVEGRTIKN